MHFQKLDDGNLLIHSATIPERKLLDLIIEFIEVHASFYESMPPCSDYERIRLGALVIKAHDDKQRAFLDAVRAAFIAYKKCFPLIDDAGKEIEWDDSYISC